MIIAKKEQFTLPLTCFTITLLFAMGLFVYNQYTANAAVSGWRAGNIIDDAVMTNKSTMTASQIQAFLNGKVPSCDTYGTKPASDFGRPDLTHAQYAKSRGWQAPPYTCLKNYKQGGKTAAQIIYSAAQRYSINPQVLLVLLQKEQSLVQDTWPLNSQYRSATGYGCPDHAPCDSDYYGLTNQIEWAAKMFRAILNNSPTWYTPYELGNNYIQYNPNASCGGSNVYIENRSTQALYNYTPYQPNSASLRAGWGTASCGSYGNRNFYLYFNSWFGSTHGTVQVQGIRLENQPFTDNPTTVSFTLKNTTKSTINLGHIGVAVRGPNGNNFDFDPVDNVKLGAGKSYTYRKTRLLNGPEGSYNFFIARFDGSKWHYPPFDDFGQTSNGAKSYTLTKQPKLTSSLSLSTSSVHKDENVTASVKVKNYSASTITFGYLAVAARDSKGRNFDFPLSEKIILDPGEEYTYQKTRSFPTTGSYSLYVTSKRDDFGWGDNYPNFGSTNLTRKLAISVKDSVTLTSPLSVTMTDPRAGNTATATFKIKNFSTKSVDVGVVAPAVRDALGTNYDFTPSSYLTLAPEQEYTYNSSRVLPASAKHTVWIANKRNGYGWSNTYPQSESANMQRSQILALKDTVTLTEPLRISMSDPNTGGTATATFKIKNFGTKSVEVGVVAAAMRNSHNSNVDFAPSSYLTLDPGEEYSYSQSRTITAADKYSAWVANKRTDHNWSAVYPGNEVGGTVRFVTLNTKKDVRLTSGLSVTKTGSTYTATFKLKNYSTKNVAVGIIAPAVRNANGTNYDFTPSPYLTLTPGQEYTYTSSRALPSGSYNFWIANKRNGYGWSSTYPESEFSTLIRKLALTVS